MSPLPLTPLGRVLFCCLLTPHLSSLLAGAPSPIDESRLLSAIAEVETGTRHLAHPSRKVGPAGERSAWQFTAATWRRYTRSPFPTASTNATLAHLVAQMHLRYLRLELESRGALTSPYTLALAWNAGPRKVYTDTAPISARNYAQRVQNLYHFGK